MPRRQRIHVPGGTYYVVRRTNLPNPIFSQPEDYAALASILPVVLKRTGARLLAYCWMPDAIHLALQIDGTPVGDFMRELTSRYAQRVHLRTGERGQLFRRPYQSTLVDPDVHLFTLIHYLHYIPVLEGLVAQPGDYLHSSHQVYLRRANQPWLQTAPVLQLIDSCDEKRTTYRRRLAIAPEDSVGRLLARGHADTPGVLGDAEFVASLPRRGRPSRSKWSLDEIAVHVERADGVSRTDLRSRSRRHPFVVARARFAWYATERRVASLSEAARYLNHSASALSRAIARHQLRYPELFSLDAFAPLTGLAPVSSGVDYRPGVTSTGQEISSSDERRVG